VTIAAVLWRRLDVPGHDACRLEQCAGGWRIEGTAVFAENGRPTQLAYQVTCDDGWRTLHGEVHGWAGSERVSFSVARAPDGVWRLNGAPVSGLEGCLDLDYGFTPATNLLQLRRAALAVGQAADVPVAWLDVSAATLDRLEQRYERRREATYWYEAPRFDYAALLELDPAGFVERYPGLWESVAAEQY